MKKIKPFVEGLSIAGLLDLKESEPAPKKTQEFLERQPGWYNYETEILDEEEGWIYEKLRKNKKGEKRRKVLQQLYRGHSGEDISFWKAKINDLALCETKRWTAIQYQKNQCSKINGVYQQVLDNTPFCCIRLTDQAPGFAWVVFPHYDHHDRGVSWEWWESNQEQNERPDCRQDIGDAWFAYEHRSRQIRQRVGYFEQVFHLALEKRYAHEFYQGYRYRQYKKKLVINGRDYLIGETNGRFGIITYPESTLVEVVEPGPAPKKDETN